MDMKGSLLIKTLEQGKKNVGTGGFLVHNENLVNTDDKWLLNNAEIEPSKTYHIAITDFLLTGKEANLDYLNPTNVDIVKTYNAVTSIADPRSDVRLAVIKYLEKK